MKPETPSPQEEPNKGMDRRTFIKAAATAAAVGAGTLGYLTREKLGFGPLSEVQKQFAAKREALAAEYKRTGELPGFAEQKELILLADLAGYMERDSDSLRMSYDEWRSRYDAFYEKVYADAAAGTEVPPQGLPTSPALGALLKLKSAFQKHAGTIYNREHSALPDPLVEGRYQCRSGTLGLEMVTREAVQQEKLFGGGETLVSVYTEGHVQPGLLLTDGTLITVEMTSAGSAVRNFGKMKDITSPVRVVRADHGSLQEALGATAHREKAVLYETVRDVRPPEQGTMARLGMFGFGEPRVPEGDIPMSHADMLPAEDVFDDSRLYNRMERIESEEEILRSIPNVQEREYVRNYMVHHRTVIGYHNSYVDVFNRVENVSDAQRGRRVPLPEFQAAEREILRLTDTLEAYTRANDLDARYERAQQILEAHGKRITTVAPSDVARVMRANLNLLRRNR